MSVKGYKQTALVCCSFYLILLSFQQIRAVEFLSIVGKGFLVEVCQTRWLSDVESSYM